MSSWCFFGVFIFFDRDGVFPALFLWALAQCFTNFYKISIAELIEKNLYLCYNAIYIICISMATYDIIEFMLLKFLTDAVSQHITPLSYIHFSSYHVIIGKDPST